MMAKKVTLVCTVCCSRNYHTTKNQYSSKRLELNKFCPICNANVLHKETK
ncbi:MAG: 50S ribosomal protein L33 [Candidatus Ureaplasma intestinipullorum]|uniref:Large ribosomal subunit protein bL33 n=1 Tax=Candidatus Ureaplasma intestinipullorum TaxID=2838770 RepID=A0A9E2KX23_9BACT|nr:50S ribosomal protein L33 [Candidatus Ureaplasma intestinipullorum]